MSANRIVFPASDLPEDANNMLIDWQVVPIDQLECLCRQAEVEGPVVILDGGRRFDLPTVRAALAAAFEEDGEVSLAGVNYRADLVHDWVSEASANGPTIEVAGWTLPTSLVRSALRDARIAGKFNCQLGTAGRDDLRD